VILPLDNAETPEERRGEDRECPQGKRNFRRQQSPGKALEKSHLTFYRLCIAEVPSGRRGSNTLTTAVSNPRMRTLVVTRISVRVRSNPVHHWLRGGSLSTEEKKEISSEQPDGQQTR